MKSYMYSGKLSAKQGMQDELADILLKAAELVSNAKGCKLYAISLEPDNTQDVFVTEIWDKKEDHDNALKAHDVRELIIKAMPLLSEMPTKGLELEVLGGLGI